MRRISLGAVYEGGLLAVVVLIVIHAPMTVGLGSLLPDYENVLKAWKEVVLGLLGIIAIILVTRHKKWPIVLRSPVILLSLLFIDIHLLMAAILFDDATSTVAGLMIDLRFILMFILAYVLILLRPQSLRRVVTAVAAGAAIVLGFALLQVTVLPDDVLSRLGYSDDTITPFTTIDRNPEFVRINSTLRGPNPLGALAVVYAALAVAYLIGKYASLSVRRRSALLIGIAVSAVVLFASFSRSAYGAFVAALTTVAVLARKPSRRMMAIAGSMAVVATVGLLLVSSSDWFSNVILHEDPESSVESKSNAEHMSSLANGAERVLAQPFGAGVGSTGSASMYDGSPSNDFIIENYYFFIAHESGWIGLVVFLGLFGVVLYELYRRRASWLALGVLGSGIGLGLIGLLLPVWADETVALIWWALAGGAIATKTGIMKGRHARTRKQKTTRTA
jgi:O-antigen ligase